jgi:DNA-binding GntR family transcriptional regulator
MARVTRETVADMALAALRSDILERRLLPGDPLREEAVARDLGVSRPTVREVFKTLLAEGLLARNSNTRVLEVTHLDADDVREIYHARRFLELSGVEAARHASPESLARLSTSLQEMADAIAADDPLALVDADTRCHEAIVGFLQSRYLSQLHQTIMTRLKLAMSRVEQGAGRDNQAVYDVHHAFYEQLISGDIEAAKRNLEERLRTSEQVILSHEGLHDEPDDRRPASALG